MRDETDDRFFIVANSIFPYGYDAITVLSLPVGAFYRARFDEKFVSDQVKRDFPLVANRKGYYCFRDFSSGAITPLRAVIIKEVNLIGSIYYIGYSAGEILDFSQDITQVARQAEQFHSEFSNSNTLTDDKPGENLRPLVLLSKTPVSFHSQTETVRGDIDVQTRRWAAIVRYLGEYKYFRYLPFFRIVGIRKLGEKSFSSLIEGVKLVGNVDYQIQIAHNLRSDSTVPHSINIERTEREEAFIERASYKLLLSAINQAIIMVDNAITITGSYDISFFTFRTADVSESTPARLSIDYAEKSTYLERLDTRLAFDIEIRPSSKFPLLRVVLLLLFGCIYFIPNITPQIFQYLKVDQRILQDLTIIAISLTSFDILNELRRVLGK